MRGPHAPQVSRCSGTHCTSRFSYLALSCILRASCLGLVGQGRQIPAADAKRSPPSPGRQDSYPKGRPGARSIVGRTGSEHGSKRTANGHPSSRGRAGHKLRLRFEVCGRPTSRNLRSIPGTAFPRQRSGNALCPSPFAQPALPSTSDARSRNRLSSPARQRKGRFAPIANEPRSPPRLPSSA
jgi:hypothetical protein